MSQATILLILLSGLLVWQLPPLVHKSEKKVIFLYLSMLLISFGIFISLSLHIHISSPSNGIVFLLNPVQDFLYHSLD